MDLSPGNYDTAARTLASDLSRINAVIDVDEAHAAILSGCAVASTPSVEGSSVGEVMCLFATLFPSDFALVELATLGAHLSREADLDRALEAFMDEDSYDLARREDENLNEGGDRLVIAAHYIAAVRNKDLARTTH